MFVAVIEITAGSELRTVFPPFTLFVSKTLSTSGRKIRSCQKQGKCDMAKYSGERTRHSGMEGGIKRDRM